MGKISRSLGVSGLVLLVAASADARLLGVSHAPSPARHERIRPTASSPQAKASHAAEGILWTTQRLGERSYWYASNGTTCVEQKLAQTVIIRCY